jgi:hypothetical protein
MLAEEELTGKNLGAAIEVHSTLGPGLQESADLGGRRSLTPGHRTRDPEEGGTP